MRILQFIPPKALVSRLVACISLLSLLSGGVCFAEAIYDLTDNAIQHARNGQLQMEREQYEEAIEELKASIRLNPFASMAAPIYNNLGLAYKATGNYPYAYASFQRACRMQPPFSLYYKNMVATYREAGQLKRVQGTLSQLVQDNPENAEAHFLLGLIHREQGNAQASQTHFRTFLKLQPESEMARAAREALK